MQFLNLIGWNLQSLSSETINPNVCYFVQMMYNVYEILFADS